MFFKYFFLFVHVDGIRSGTPTDSRVCGIYVKQDRETRICVNKIKIRN